MTVHFIGAGPGAADLITVRGQRLLSTCRVCLYAGSLVPAELLDGCPSGARLVDTAQRTLDEIVAECVAATRDGHDVARLHSGDLSLYSATKSIGGHSDLLAGAAMGPAKIMALVHKAREVFGPIAEPTMAWLVERSLKTMPLRVRAANANALELATRLKSHPAVAQVFYPGLPSHPGHAIAARQMTNGFGPLLSFEVRGGAEAALGVVNRLAVIKHGASLGGVESLASLAAYASHMVLGREGRARAGIPEGLIRISAGVEHVEDLWADMAQALPKGQ